MTCCWRGSRSGTFTWSPNAARSWKTCRRRISFKKSDFVPAVERGLALGGSAGALAGLVAIALPPASTVLAGGVLLGSALAGAGVGAWAGSLIGVSTPSSRIKQFEEAIEAGRLLVLADVPKDRVAEIEARIKKHLPECDIEGTEPIIPAFP